MSYDFEIATRRIPAADVVERFARDRGFELTVEGDIGEGSRTLVTRRDGGEREIDVDGPVRAEAEDLTEDVAAVAPDAR